MFLKSYRESGISPIGCKGILTPNNVFWTAEELYITASAVIKQINSLETSLGLKLFDRTHRGLEVTNAGKSLYQDAKYVIQYCKDAVTRAQDSMENEKEILVNMGQNIDVIAGIFDDTMLNLRKCNGLEISRKKFCIAVSRQHRMAAREQFRTPIWWSGL